MRNKLFITDLEGKQIEVTDLSKAIDQADFGRDAKHVDAELKMQDFDVRINKYWQHLYDQLIIIKNNLNKNS